MARPRQPSGIPRMERFVQAVVAGGLALVAGLWLLSSFEYATPLWILGGGLVVLGVGGLTAGIWSQIEYRTDHSGRP